MADNDSCTEGDRYSTAVPPYAEERQESTWAGTYSNATIRSR